MPLPGAFLAFLQIFLDFTLLAVYCNVMTHLMRIHVYSRFSLCSLLLETTRAGIPCLFNYLQRCTSCIIALLYRVYIEISCGNQNVADLPTTPPDSWALEVIRPIYKLG